VPLAPWPDSDPDLLALLDAAPDRALHELMCACAEHAREQCKPLYRAARYTSLPDDLTIEQKRLWLRGEANEDELRAAQQAAVHQCYWGNPIALGAALLGCAWQPGPGLLLPEDEQYAESMTWFDTTLEAACDVMRQAELAVGELTYRSLRQREDPTPSETAALAARTAERAWQRAHAFTLLSDPPPGL